MPTPRIGFLAAVPLVLVASLLSATPGQAADGEVQAGACLAVEDGWNPTSAYAVVDCAEKHNSEVYEIVAYPSDAAAPSTLTDEELNAIGEECSREAFDAWFGKDVLLPLSVWRWFISVPSDEAWQAGDRDVLCRTIRPSKDYSVLEYTGSIPELVASTPILEWLTCMNKAPKSGASNSTAACDSKSVWLLLGGAPVKGKVTAKYPKDLQAAADKACRSNFTKYGKKGSTGVAALLAKKYVSGGTIFAECFVQVKDWNGKVK